MATLQYMYRAETVVYVLPVSNGAPEQWTLAFMIAEDQARTYTNERNIILLLIAG